MTQDQILILSILACTVGMFLWGRWRHDMVAMGSLLACVLAGVLPAVDALAGFGHPAVITVACVLVMSRGLLTSGAVDVLTRYALPKKSGPTLSLLALMGLGAVLSGFMNNVGAMALLMPVAIQLAKRLELTPGQVLMPLAFGTILGGMTTLIGTPPNLIVSGFRAETGAGGFGMFDFTPIGLAVALVGVVFVALAGWRLVPARKQSGLDGFETSSYLTEARVLPDSKSIGKSLLELETVLDEAGAQVVGLVRNEIRMTAPGLMRRVHAGDILVIEAEADALSGLLSSLELRLEESGRPPEPEDDENPVAADLESKTKAKQKAKTKAKVVEQSQDPRRDKTGQGLAASAALAKGEDKADEDADDEPDDDKTDTAGEIVLMELVVLPGSMLAGRSASDVLLRTRYGINMLALSRQGDTQRLRLRLLPIKPGDLLLMQGSPDAINEFAADNGCVPLAERELRIPNQRKAWLSVGIMTFSVGMAAFGLLPAAISFAMGVLASMALRTVPPRGVYEAIDWPVVVLLAALIPVAGAMQTTGTADLIARLLLENVAQGHAVVGLALILVVTMFLSDLMNNAATAAVMCPIALGTASALGVNPDSFLMAVAIGASCAFLTPIGHQNNTLILGPGGFRFGDYWRLGLPLEILVAAVSIPMLLLVWPL
ncbi:MULTISPECIES: SLC13 family permease [unclassified Polaromonas]|uniref:SLC13 family permease n=1 Tax=unclassified Polaromonas TaxID=2638319 RepID=UPI0018C97FFE|nr:MULTISPECIES: SLC13 family permease [unclassified Polaromonas]MBG6072946.1 di/tricarboxylate transporter [Polaromonas sp. CG_9.7]MBG6114904.1 di/tricarboxylate transporter [Polaromonas sp. CG_9.2]MDH6183626.1 di/tricarboxylate transporter [Polaromonas sp. CG_23.6]